MSQMPSTVNSVVVSAPGKVILHGEHAVVYGKRALAASLNLRTFLRLTSNSTHQVSLRLPDIDVAVTWTTSELQEAFTLPFCDPMNPVSPSADLLAQVKKFAGIESDVIDTKQLAVVAFLYLFLSVSATDKNVPSVTIEIASSLPTGAGLGSSAAYSTCLASSLLEHRRLISVAPKVENSNNATWSGKDIDLINQWAFLGERIIHGNPSGIDNSVSTYGGALNFQAGQITPLDRVPQLRILLLNTRVPRSTKIMVAGVKDRYNKFPEIIGPVLDSIEGISQWCEKVFTQIDTTGATEEHYNILKDLIDMNQNHLRTLGVSHPALDQACHVTQSHGLHSKLTGAGGGGCAFTLVPPGTCEEVIGSVRREMEELGYDCWETTMGAPGVLQHLSLDGSFPIPSLFPPN
ncbi:Mevalonate kinase [Lamellibrachia satsuma]|nr:Mevalonate kinase [Lamellibrachia satsuma]